VIWQLRKFQQLQKVSSIAVVAISITSYWYLLIKSSRQSWSQNIIS